MNKVIETKECYFCEEPVGHDDCDRCDGSCASCHDFYGCE